MKSLIFALACATSTLAVTATSASAEPSAEADQVRRALRDSARSLDRAVKGIAPKLRALKTPQGTPPAAGARRAAIAAVRSAQAKNQAAQAAFKRAAAILGQRAAAANAGLAQTQSLETALVALIKDLEAEDRMGNFEIQDLMSRFNQASRLAAGVLKSEGDAAKSIIGNMR